MNNRIEQLAAEAEEYAKFHFAISNETEFDIFKRRFAELLIAECATVVSIAVDHREPASTYFSKVYDHFYSENYIVKPTSMNGGILIRSDKMVTDREYAKMCVGDGWHPLVDEAFDLVEKHNGSVAQIKEKFGLLRIYATVPRAEDSEKVWEAIAELENRSASMCEVCGAPATQRSRGLWIRTICEPCEEKICTR